MVLRYEINVSIIYLFIVVLSSQTSMLHENAAKGWNSLGHWRSILWVAELGLRYSNVYGKIIQ